jgi:hypothetical protein
MRAMSEPFQFVVEKRDCSGEIIDVALMVQHEEDLAT